MSTSSNDSPKKQWAPDNWLEVWKLIETMRQMQVAPVDSDGCSKLADPTEYPKTYRYQVLLSLMLSSQTRDEVTAATIRRMQQRNCADMASISKMQQEDLAELLKPVSFYNVKAKNIKRTTEILLADYDGDIPTTFDELIALPGVGPKMAHLVMQIAFNEVCGISVDTHVHRISNRLKWVRKPTNEPEKTRVELESWLPRDRWVAVNHMLVGFGQTVCKPVSPRCVDCLCRQLCPFGRANTRYLSHKAKTETESENKPVLLAVAKIEPPMTVDEEPKPKSKSRSTSKSKSKVDQELKPEIVETQRVSKKRAKKDAELLKIEMKIDPDAAELASAPNEPVRRATRSRVPKKIAVEKDVL